MTKASSMFKSFSVSEDVGDSVDSIDQIDSSSSSDSTIVDDFSETEDEVEKIDSSETEEEYPLEDNEDSQEDDSEEEEEIEEEVEEETENVYSEEEDSDSDIDSEPSFTPFVSNLVEEGVLYFDEEKEYEDSPEGFKEIIRDTVTKEVEDWKSSLSERSLQLVEFIESGGDIENFVEKFSETSYAEIDLEDESNQKNLVEEYLYATGVDEDEIKEMLQEYEDSGVLEKQAKLAQKFLAKNQEQERQEFIERQRQEQERMEFERQAQMEELQNDIINSNFETFEIPKSEAKKFLQYLTEPVDKQGRTRYMLEDSYEDRIKMAYMKYKKFDFSDVEKKAKTKATIEMKKNLSRFTDSNAKRNPGIYESQKGDSNKLEFPSIFKKMRGNQDL